MGPELTTRIGACSALSVSGYRPKCLSPSAEEAVRSPAQVRLLPYRLFTQTVVTESRPSTVTTARMLKTALDPPHTEKERLSISWHFQVQQNTLVLFVLAATEEPQKAALVSPSSKDFAYDCLRTYFRAQISLTHSFMKFSTRLPFCALRAEAIPSPLLSFVGRLKTVCFCLLH